MLHVTTAAVNRFQEKAFACGDYYGLCMHHKKRVFPLNVFHKFFLVLIFQQISN